MRKITLKRIISTTLCASLVVGLAACGGKKAGDDPNGGNAGGGTDPAAAIANSKIGVYKSVSIPVSDDFKDYTFTSLTKQNDKIYAIANKYTWVEGENSEAVEDGEVDVAETFRVEISSETANEEYYDDDYNYDDYYDYGYSINEYQIYSSNLDGSGQSSAMMDMTMDGDVDAWLGNSTFDSKGNAYGIMNFGYSDEATGEWYDCFYLMGWNTDGSQKFNVEVSKSASSDYYTYCQSIGVNDKDQIVILMAGENEMMIVVDESGNVLSTSKIQGDYTQNIDRTFLYGDKLYITAYNDDWTKYFLHELDSSTGKEITSSEIPTIISNSNGLYCAGEGTLISLQSAGVYKYVVGDKEASKLLDYVNSDMTQSYFDSFVYLDDDNFIVMYSDYSTGENNEIITKLTHVDPKDIPDKVTLTYGCVYLDDSVKSDIIRFNKSNDQFRITIKDYYDGASDWESAIANLNNDITSGKMPDIISGTSINLANYASKGLFTDIKKLITDDAELSKNEYLENVFDMYTANGVMYALPYCFGVQTYVAKTSLVGHPDQFSLKDAQEVLKKMPEGATLFGDTTRDSFLYNALSFGGDTFIDYNNGVCHFDSQDFIDVLEYAKSLPKEYSEDYWQDYDYMSYMTQYREDRALLSAMYFGSISESKYTIKGYIGEPVTFVGFPCESGNGSVLSSYGNPLAISAKSTNIAGAWQYVRQYITEDYQSQGTSGNGYKYDDTYFYGMPVLKSAFEEAAMKATERPYWTDEDGKKQEYDDTFYLGDEEIVLEPFTKDEVKEICDFIYSLHGSYFYDDKIYEIIEEETSAYFAGQKQAKDCAAIIQNRVQLMMDESK